MSDIQNFSMPTAFLGKKAQLAFVVSDLEKALKFWTEVMRVGPFFTIEKSVGDRTVRYRGKETGMDMSLSFAYMGDIQIEIVHPTNDEPSIFTEFLSKGREGLQHIAFWPEDFDAACASLAAQGCTEVMSMYMLDGSRNVAYFETPDSVGPMIELVPMTPHRTAYFSRMERVCANWDGVTRPVRKFVDRAAFLASGEGEE